MKRRILMMGVLAASLSGQMAMDAWTAAMPTAARHLSVGDSLAGLTGLDQSGVRRSGASLAGQKGLLVTFLRSADWCPSCKVQLVELEAMREIAAAAGYGIAAVTIDEVPVLAGFAAERRIQYPILAGRKAIAEFGMIDPRFDADPARKGAPHPAVYATDRSLVITHAFPEGERHTVAGILAQVGITQAPSAVRKKRTPHLMTASWSSDHEVDANRRFALVMDVVPHPGMHVYAPGDHKYKTIKLVIDPQESLELTPLQFPASEPYVFKALNETVPVYSRSFRLAQGVMVRRQPGAATPPPPPREIRVTGRFEYQACDDVICYAAATVPLEWRVKIR